MASRKNTVYEDEDVTVLMYPQPASPGHMLVLPRKHFTILEQVPPEVLGKMGVISNKMSMIQFETLGVAGTNMLVQNGVGAGQTMPHFSMHLIPRNQDDGINFSWKSRPLTEEQMAAVELGLKEQLELGPQEERIEAKKEEKQKHSTVLKYPERIP